MDFDRLLTLLRALEEHEVRYKVVGGVAMNVQGLARATRDLDLFVEPSDDNVARLRAALRAVFDDPTIDEITGEDLRGSYPAIQYVPPEPGFHLDILARLGEAFEYDDVRTELHTLEGVTIAVATKDMLYEMKCETVRPRDRLDCEWLRPLLRGEEES